MMEYRIYTGPVRVQRVADRIKQVQEHGPIEITQVGHAHVYLKTKLDRQRLTSIIRDHVGQDFTFFDIKPMWMR